MQLAPEAKCLFKIRVYSQAIVQNSETLGLAPGFIVGHGSQQHPVGVIFMLCCYFQQFLNGLEGTVAMQVSNSTEIESLTMLGVGAKYLLE